MGDEPAPVREVLRIGQTVEYSFPLPAMTPVWVDRLQGNRRLSSRLAFRAWDMNDDGRFDMLEAIDPGGRVLFRAYDLDFDGEVDETEEIPPPSGDETVPVSSLH
ncbi:MAG: hypothetical protein H6618_04545 [Deltaproteobacteria bacterium]|nr:hypothetical protein [Deltaproteobacteria bacterium]